MPDPFSGAATQMSQESPSCKSSFDPLEFKGVSGCPRRYRIGTNGPCGWVVLMRFWDHVNAQRKVPQRHQNEHYNNPLLLLSLIINRNTPQRCVQRAVGYASCLSVSQAFKTGRTCGAKTAPVAPRRAAPQRLYLPHSKLHTNRKLHLSYNEGKSAVVTNNDGIVISYKHKLCKQAACIPTHGMQSRPWPSHAVRGVPILHGKDRAAEFIPQTFSTIYVYIQSRIWF